MTMYLKRCLGCGANLGPDSLVCTYCGASHVVTGDDLHTACGGCGALAKEGHRVCATCGAQLLFRCPECAADNALGSRYCHRCAIEFRAYREPRLERAENLVPFDGVEAQVVGWLESRWFKARDIGPNLEVPVRVLYWVPFWRFRARAEGHVEGQVSQTHYRSTTRRRYDHEAKRWVTESDSEPYKVWSHVSKDFEEPLELTEPAAGPEAKALYAFLGSTWKKATSFEPLPSERKKAFGERWDRPVEPAEPALSAYATLHGRAEAQLRATLLERVELLRVRYHHPSLQLLWFPVWEVDYRYRAKLGKVRINGATKKIKGDRITLFSQLLG